MPVYIPNLISFGRLLAVPVNVWLILSGQLMAAFWLFIIAGISDAADGFIAKRFDVETELGKFLDPIADKALLVSVYITLGHENHIATWLVIMVVFRDVLIVGGAILFQTLTHSLTMKPLVVSKINTAVQIILAALVLGALGFEMNSGWFVLIDIMVYVTAMTTLISGSAYVITWGRIAATMEDGK